MKSILCVLLVMSLTTTSAFAATRTVKDDVATLGKLAMGLNEHDVKGGNALEILKNYIDEQYGEGEELLFKEIGDMDWSDEVNEGFTSAKSAAEMGSFAEGVLEEKLEGLDEESDANEIKEIKANIYDLNHKWAPIIKKLDRQGVKFGYTGSGPGYCGISFIEMLIIDEKEQKVYEVYLSEGGEC